MYVFCKKIKICSVIRIPVVLYRLCVCVFYVQGILGVSSNRSILLELERLDESKDEFDLFSFRIKSFRRT